MIKLIILINSLGDVDFLSEFKAVLKVANGALVVIDRVESLCIQTKTVMKIINLF